MPPSERGEKSAGRDVGAGSGGLWVSTITVKPRGYEGGGA